jgi:hypothetical protein
MSCLTSGNLFDIAVGDRRVFRHTSRSSLAVPNLSLTFSTLLRSGLIALTVSLAGCGRSDNSGGAGSDNLNATQDSSGAKPVRKFDPAHLFTEVTSELGFDANPPLYPDGTFMTPEITPGGVAVFDYDNDGLQDILVVRHPAPLPWEEQLKASAPNRLYRQQKGHTFVEVPDAAGLGGKGYHHGVAIGDANNDGLQDVYICNFGGPDEFFLNDGKGRFTDATESAGFLKGKTPVLTSPDNWSSTAAFFDADADGDLDLWVVHFATFDSKRRCKASSAADEWDYCGPHTFPGQLATFWRNDGAGRFTDVTAESGIKTAARGWGVIAADLTGDGKADVFQANDEEPNQLWVNQGDGTFVDEALLRGCALNAFGSVEANMGVAIGDVRNTGTGGFDLLSTHFAGETNTLWSSQGEGLYADTTSTAGMGLIDRPFTGWGCGFFDYDNDGFLDLAIANGRVTRGPVRADANVGAFWNRFAEPNLLFRGDGTGKFTDASKSSGNFAQKLEVHRALAFADLHNRGSLDLLCVNLDNTLRVFRNDALPDDHHWLQVLPTIGKREAIGAVVTIKYAGRRQSALCLRAYSYLASNDPRVHFGLGKANTIESVEIVWPSGSPKREEFKVTEIDRVLVMPQGSGKAL